MIYNVGTGDHLWVWYVYQWKLHNLLSLNEDLKNQHYSEMFGT